MTATQVVRMRSGGTVSIRTGVMRGAGPQGPVGPPGATGTTGPAGPQGPPGTINDLSAELLSTASVAVDDSAWFAGALDQTIDNDDGILVDPVDDAGFQFAAAGRYMVIATGTYDPTSGVNATGSRRLRLVDQGGTVIGHPVEEAAAPTAQTTVELVTVIDANPAYFYHLEARALDAIAVSWVRRTVRIIRIGSGPAGVEGPVGPPGSTGPQGPQGVAGNAGSGYATYDALIGGTDSSIDPGGSILTTTDQGVEYPDHTQMPSSPYFLKRLANSIERKLVARFADDTDRIAKRASRQIGEVTVLLDTGVPYYHEDDGTDQMLARVIVSSAAPASGAGAGAPGTIWFQV